MKIITLLLFVVSLIGTQNTKAQTAAADSENTISTAKWNARSFRLSKELLKKFKADNFPSSSDYFKPTIAYAHDPALLNDSLYVQNFRDAAFYNTVNERAPRNIHDILIPRLPGTQATEPKYTEGVAKTAKNDARSFRLTKEGRKKFKDEHLPNTSDYFKPNLFYVSNPALLNDSSYVKAFREVAFYKAIDQKDHAPGKILIIVGSITVGITVLILLVTAALNSAFS